MTRLFALLVSAALAGFSAAQDAAKTKDKDAVPKKEAPKEGEKAPEQEDLDVHKTAERIAENAQKAGDRLKEKDPGAATRKIQQDILKDIDALIRKAQQPPPPPMSNDMDPMPPPPKSDMMPPPMGGGTGGGNSKDRLPKGGMGGSQPKSPGGASGGTGTTGQDRRPGRQRRERRPRGGSPMDTGSQPMAKDDPGGKEQKPAKIEPKGGKDGGLADRFGRPSPKRENDKFGDLYKDVWGHLPDRLRQEMDLYYREQFMPRYSELLRRYYAALAEQRKKGSEDR